MTARHAAFSPAADPACIAPGECLLLPVSRGTLLFAVEGHVRVVEPPRWVAEQMFSVERRLEPGQAHEFEREGWVQLSALAPAPARIAQVPPLAARPRLAERLARLRQALAGRVVPTA